jgi:manganese/zinc/iron transport system ATP- binding protein
MRRSSSENGAARLIKIRSSKEEMTTDNAVKIDHLTVNYNKSPVLWEVTCEIPSGKLVGIIGPNGAGKSTLLKAILGLITPISGQVKFFGRSLKEMRQRIAYVPQRSSVDWDFPITVFDVVLMGRYGKMGVLKRAKAADREAVKRALNWVGLEAFSHRQISQLSGGQQQRLFIARALVQEADIYFMDEPFSGVDVATEKALMQLLEQLKSQGKTLVLVHHDLSSVERYFDWVLLLNTCLIGAGPTKEIFNTETVMRTYGRSSSYLLDQAAKLSQHKQRGIL